MLFGSLVHPDAVPRYPEVSEAANRFQLGLLCGFVECGIDAVLALSALPIATFPRPRRLLVRQQRWTLGNGIRVVAPGFINLAAIKTFLAHSQLRRLGVRAARDEPPDAVLCYNPVPGPASAGLAMARRLGLPFVTIAADVTPASAVLPASRRVLFRWSRRILRASDGLVALSGHTVEETGFERPWVKVDGGLSRDWDDLPVARPRPKTIVYAGTPAEVSGARLLLAAFRILPDPDAHLIFTGRGGLEGEIREAAAVDPRIQVAGFVQRREMQRLLCSATVLVNPRPGSYPENRYNFPAKLLDYLASGRPVITTLAGDLDPEYRAVTIPLLDETPHALAALLEDVIRRPESELFALGSRGRAFILANRRWEHQAARVLEFLESLRREPT